LVLAVVHVVVEGEGLVTPSVQGLLDESQHDANAESSSLEYQKPRQHVCKVLLLLAREVELNEPVHQEHK
jgi:hypothetical protein